jgi:hypothetical protein
VDPDYEVKRIYFSYSKKKRIRPYYPIPALYPAGCLTCGGKNYEVKYHGERHICHKCKAFL